MMNSVKVTLGLMALMTLSAILFMTGCNTAINTPNSGSSSSAAPAFSVYNDFESTNVYTIWAWGGTSVAYITNDVVSHGGTNCFVGYEQDGSQGWNQDGFGTMAGYNTGGNLTNNFDMTGGGRFNTLVIWIWAENGSFDNAAFGLGIYGVTNTGGAVLTGSENLTNAQTLLGAANSCYTNKSNGANWVQFIIPFYGTAGITNLCRDQGGNVPDLTHVSAIQLAFYWPKIYLMDDIYVTNM